MPVPIDQKYTDAISTLLGYLEDEGRTVFYKEGRKFDKILIDNGVRYFVSRADGTVYGAKSALAPNFDWWFGTIYTADRWNWTGYHPVPLMDGFAILRKSYGKYRHYMPVPVAQDVTA